MSVGLGPFMAVCVTPGPAVTARRSASRAEYSPIPNTAQHGQPDPVVGAPRPSLVKLTAIAASPNSAGRPLAGECATMDLADWLRQSGLEQYEPAFQANHITAALLPDLTQDDLRDLGIISVGHRRILMNAIAALRADHGAA